MAKDDIVSSYVHLSTISKFVIVRCDRASLVSAAAFGGEEVAEQGLQKARNLPADTEKQNQHD
jgi:hypothetical protein